MVPARPKGSGDPAKRAAGASRRGTDDATAKTMGGLRGRVTPASRVMLLWISRLPPLAVPAAVLAAMLVGLSAPLVFALPAFGAVALFVAWLAYLSWPALTTSARLVRGLMIALVAGSAAARVAGWL